MERWKQRFNNFEKAYKKLSYVCDLYKQDTDDEIYQMALIQSFEFTYELSWKVLKDYLYENGIEAKSPRETIKEAFATDIIDDGQGWIDMMGDRNKTSHTYDEPIANSIAENISNMHVKNIGQVYQTLKEKL